MKSLSIYLLFFGTVLDLIIDWQELCTTYFLKNENISFLYLFLI
jgi:hypothetical protein